MADGAESGGTKTPGGARATVANLMGHVRSRDQALGVLAAVVVGGAVGGVAIGFRHLIRLSQALFFQSWEVGVETADATAWWLLPLIPAVGGLIVGLIGHYLADEVRGSGVPEVMESVARRAGFIRARVAGLKALAAAISIGSGGSAGREGPIVQIGAAAASLGGQGLAVDAVRLRTFVACGVAAAIAATFNAPIAGALFAVEVILRNFALHNFSAVVISSVSATVLSRHFLGDFPAIVVPPFEFVSALEMLPYAGLGLLAALVSVGFIRLLYTSQDLFGRVPVPLWARPALGGLLVGLMALIFPQVLGVGYETLDASLWDRLPLALLLALPILKIVATSATIGSGGSGGVFAPSLFIGAMLGGAVGYGAGAWLPEASGPGAYALVGMGAVVAGVTHGPISAILIIFELTGDYHVIPPLMAACTLSVLVASWLQPYSVYTLKLKKRGVDLLEGQELNLLRGLYVREVYAQDAHQIPAATPVSRVVETVLDSEQDTFFVVGKGDEVLGFFTLSDLRDLVAEQDLPEFIVAADIARADPPTVRLSDNLDLVMHLLGRHEVDEIAVVSGGKRPRMVGAVRHRDVISAYNREVFRQDLAGGFRSVVAGVDAERGVEIAPGFHLWEVDVPFAFVGRTIREVDVRARFGLQVILVRKPVEDDESLPSRPGAFPAPDYVLRAGDCLLVLGSREDIRRFRAGLPRGQ